PERCIVEACMIHITEIKQRQTAGVTVWCSAQNKNSAETTVCGPGLGLCAGVSRFVKKEFCEKGAWTELAVLGAFEWSTLHRFCQRVCIKRCKAIDSRIVDGDPSCLEALTVGMKVFDIGREDVRVCRAGMEHNRLAWIG